MRYLIYSSKYSAESRTRQIAERLGCGDDIYDATQNWFGIIEHPTLPFYALCVPFGEEDKITKQQVNQLKTYEFMLQNGWFVEKTNLP
jgi:hypothetical protein